MHLLTQYICTAIASISLALYLSWKLTLVIVAGIPATIAMMPVFSARMQPHMRAEAAHLSEAARHVSGSLGAIETVKCCNGEPFELGRYAGAVRRARGAFDRQVAWNALQAGALRLVMLGMFAQGFWFGSMLLRRGEITIARILSTFWASVLAVQALMQILPFMMRLEKGRAAGQKLRAAAVQIESVHGDGVEFERPYAPDTCSGDVVLSLVSFSYPSRPNMLVMNDVSLFFPAGDMTFLVGQSGSGKSTVGQLLVKFYKPSRGTITIDGALLQELDTQWVRKNVLLVEQQSVLFTGSIRENIALGQNPDWKMLYEESIVSAAEFSRMREAILDMPQGFETQVGSKGDSLSGGQRQRLALARAWLRNPAILILDESTSALDRINRLAIIQAIRKWRKGKTTIVITHDLSIIEPDDFVYVMREGAVVQEGYRKALDVDGSAFHDMMLNVDEEPAVSPSTPRPNHYGSESMPEDLLDLLLQEVTDNDYAARPQTIHINDFGTPFWKYVPPLSSQNWESGVLPEHRPSVSNSEHSAMGEAREVIQTFGTQIRRLSCGFAPDDDDIELQPMHSTKRESTNLIILSISDILKTVWPILNRAQRCSFIVGLASTAVYAVSTPIFAYVFSKLLNTLYTPSDTSQAAKYSLIVIAVAVADAAAIFVGLHQLQCSGQAWASAARVAGFGAVLAQPRGFFDAAENEASRLAGTLDHHADEMQHLVGRFVGIVVIVVVMLGTAILWSLATCWRLTLVLIACSPVLYVVTAGQQAVSGELDRQHANAAQRAGSVFAETFSSIKTVRALSIESHLRKKHAHATTATLRVGIRRALSSGLLFGLSESGMYFLTALVFHYGAVLVRTGAFSLTSVVQAFVLLLFSVSNATMALAVIPQTSLARDAASRVLRLARLPPTEGPGHEGDVRLGALGDIVLRDVSFAYPSRPSARVLCGVSLAIPAGHCVAVAGRSGSGKSSLAALLLKLYPLPRSSSGDITIGGRSLMELHTASLRARVALVPQQPALLRATAHDNIAYGLPPGSPLATRANVVAAARAAGIHDFIASLPQGYDTLLGSGGGGGGDGAGGVPGGEAAGAGAVSGGQAQRIAIARALVRRPSALVLDEPTAALDAESAANVRETVARLLAADQAALLARRAAGNGDAGGAGGEGMTVVVMTHSREMMRLADWVCMLEKGRVAEVGTFDELVRRGGRFAALVNGRPVGSEDRGGVGPAS
jgi:ATP-binding cassette subfamily B (MDR/TAP) protein 1